MKRTGMNSRPLLVVRAEVDSHMLREFMQWNRCVHMPRVLRIPGIIGGYCLRTSEGSSKSITVYIYRDESVIQMAMSSPEAQAARDDWDRWAPHVRDVSIDILASVHPVTFFQLRN